ncbi:MAG: hypothetical protein RR626_04820 [Anaerovoracaceae bacterium]
MVWSIGILWRKLGGPQGECSGKTVAVKGCKGEKQGRNSQGVNQNEQE